MLRFSVGDLLPETGSGGVIASGFVGIELEHYIVEINLLLSRGTDIES
jgi:hypothetical protein